MSDATAQLLFAEAFRLQALRFELLLMNEHLANSTELLYNDTLALDIAMGVQPVDDGDEEVVPVPFFFKTGKHNDFLQQVVEARSKELERETAVFVPGVNNVLFSFCDKHDTVVRASRIMSNMLRRRYELFNSMVIRRCRRVNSHRLLNLKHIGKFKKHMLRGVLKSRDDITA